MPAQTRSGGTKRAPATSDTSNAAKVARTGRVGGVKKKAWQTQSSSSSSSSQALQWLLSDEARDMANPELPAGHGEIDAGPNDRVKPAPDANAGKHEDEKANATILRYPHSDLTPFQNLVAACLLSKPISHRLGLRTIQTLFNPPFGLRTLSDLDAAGYEGRRKVMWEARTQHKEKTAAQLGNVTKGLRELSDNPNNEDDLSKLESVRKIAADQKDSQKAAKAVSDRLTDINGIGPGVASIFLRRVQQDWKEVFPYADDRALADARKFGLIGEKDGAEELSRLVGDDRAKFVRLLDTLIGLDLEKVTDKALKKIKT